MKEPRSMQEERKKRRKLEALERWKPWVCGRHEQSERVRQVLSKKYQMCLWWWLLDETAESVLPYWGSVVPLG
jgi:hypothetical protein